MSRFLSPVDTMEKKFLQKFCKKSKNLNKKADFPMRRPFIEIESISLHKDFFDNILSFADFKKNISLKWNFLGLFFLYRNLLNIFGKPNLTLIFVKFSEKSIKVNFEVFIGVKKLIIKLEFPC